jgi:hypothetical protein
MWWFVTWLLDGHGAEPILDGLKNLNFWGTITGTQKSG